MHPNGDKSPAVTQNEYPASAFVRAVSVAEPRRFTRGRRCTSTGYRRHLAAFADDDRPGPTNRNSRIDRRDYLEPDLLAKSARTNRAAQASLQISAPKRRHRRSIVSAISPPAASFNLSSRPEYPPRAPAASLGGKCS